MRFGREVLFGLVLLSGCASQEDVRAQVADEAETAPSTTEVAKPNGSAEVSDIGLEPQIARSDDFGSREVPRINVAQIGADDAEQLPDLPNRKFNVTVPSQSIPDFVNTVFGEMLGIGFVLGPGIEGRTSDQIALRSVQDMQADELFDVALNALEDYGIGAYFEDNMLHIVESDVLKRSMPRFIKSRARSSVPTGLRPVVQFVELISVDSNEMAGILEDAFPDKSRLTVKSNRGANSLTISGLPEDVDAALGIIDTVDEPRFAGTKIVTFRPRNWNAEQLTKQLADQLTVEGYAVSTTAAAPRSITILPIAFTNQISIFTRNTELRDYVVESARRLDSSAEPLDKSQQTFAYKAQHYDATELAAIIDKVLNASERPATVFPSSGTQPAVPASAAVSDFTTGSEPSLQTGRIIVEPQGNRLIFYGSREEYDSLLGLLEQIDTPADEVLIEVTIAEVSLTDETRSGLEFLFEQLGSKGFAVGLGTTGGLGLSSGGFTGSYSAGDYVVDFGAFASNNQINVLSEPHIVTKSGSSASINVGSEVPIITSQRAAQTQNDGSTDILQTVQYRSTGVILNIEPIVFSDYRIDLKISQEVSSAEINQNQAIASPVISNRSLTTELSLQDGQSAILGGLIENRFTRGQTGVPILKDIPFLGRAFKTETLNSSQTILLVMITPYVLTEPSDVNGRLNQLRGEVNDAFDENLYNSAGTLIKPRQRFQVGGGDNTTRPPPDEFKNE